MAQSNIRKMIKAAEEAAETKEPSKELMEKMNFPVGFDKDGQKSGPQKTDNRRNN